MKLPAAYADFLQIAGGFWLTLTLPDTENIGIPLQNSVGLYASDVIQRGSDDVRDLIDCTTIGLSSNVIAIGQDGMIGDRIILVTGAVAARVAVCTNDEPGRFLDPLFELAPDFDQFLDRLLGASKEGREKLTYWMD